MTRNPLISVIIPAYNAEHTIGTAIESILRQTYTNIELIIVDDGSTDGTKKIIDQYVKRDSRVRVISGTADPNRFDKKLNRNINAGWSARNTGIENAKGEYITFQDADDASFLNRIEIQLKLLKRYQSSHLSIDWYEFDEKYINKKLDISKFQNSEVVTPKQLYTMSQNSKGIVAKVSTGLNSLIPFHVKRLRIINKLFFGSLENYPGPGNSPLFERKVVEKVRFRSLKNRIWPSFMGRGADRDFNFQVAETFKNSHVVFTPLYLWRIGMENKRYNGISVL